MSRLYLPDLKALAIARDAMLFYKTSVPHRFCDSRSKYRKVLRMLGASHATHEAISDVLRLKRFSESEHFLSEGNQDLLFLYDGSSVNLQHLASKLFVNDPKIGVLSDNKTLGLFFQAGLVVCSDPDKDIPLGLSYFNTYCRPFNRERYDRVNPKPIEEKETYEWLRGMEMSSSQFSLDNRRRIHISDRGSDVYAYLHKCLELGEHFIVRSKHPRKLLSGGLNLHRFVSEMDSVKYEMSVKVTDEKRQSKTTTLLVNSSRVELVCPEDRTGQGITLSNIVLNVVYAQEVATLVPQGEKPLRWIILTSLPVDTPEQLAYVIHCYRKRWLIEELFKTVKSDEMKVEENQLGSGQAIENLLAISLDAAIDVLALKQHRDDEQTDATSLFDATELEIIEAVTPELEGKTARQKNIYRPQSAAWACWTIARLGGWKGNAKSKDKPGVKTFRAGLIRLQERKAGWLLAKKRMQKNQDTGRKTVEANQIKESG